MAKWVALILAAVYTLERLAYHAWSDLVVLWTSIGLAFLFIELRGAGPELAWIRDLRTRLRPKPKLHIVQKSSERRMVEPFYRPHAFHLDLGAARRRLAGD